MAGSERESRATPERALRYFLRRGRRPARTVFTTATSNDPSIVVFGVGGIREDAQEFLVPVWSAAILGRASAPARQARRASDSLLDVPDMLHRHGVLLAITEVVLILESGARAKAEA